MSKQEYDPHAIVKNFLDEIRGVVEEFKKNNTECTDADLDRLAHETADTIISRSDLDNQLLFVHLPRRYFSDPNYCDDDYEKINKTIRFHIYNTAHKLVHKFSKS